MKISDIFLAKKTEEDLLAEQEKLKAETITPPTFSPTSFSDVQSIIDELKLKHPVTVDLKNVDSSTIQRVVDILTGSAYALDAKITCVENDVYLIVFDY